MNKDSSNNHDNANNSNGNNNVADDATLSRTAVLSITARGRPRSNNGSGAYVCVNAHVLTYTLLYACGARP